METIPNVTVGENERGVHFKRFGGGVDTSVVYLPGEYYIPPFDRLILYRLNSRSGKEAIEIVSKNEVKITVFVEYSFKPIPEKIAQLHYFIGTDIHNYLVKPKINSAVKDYFQDYPSNEISLVDKIKFEGELFNIAKRKIAERYIELEAFKISEFVHQ